MRQPAPRLRRRWLSRWLLALGVLSAIVPQFASAVHMALERHVRCALHGELMHAGEHKGEHGDDTATALPTSDEQATVRATHETPHTHDHCDQFLPRPTVTAPMGPAVSTRIPRALSPTTGAAPASPRVTIALLDLSPKTSPPAA